MVTATTTRRPSKAEAPAAPTTFAEVAAAKMADTLTRYRTFVTRAAGGESLNAEELDKVLELLAYLRLPEYAWTRDVAAHRDHAAASKAVDEMRSTKAADAAKAEKVAERIKQIDEELKSLRQELHNLTTVSDLRRVGQGQRVNELMVNHPHLFAELPEAVRLRQEDRDKATGGRHAGDSREPQTTWSIGG
jgi:hypothetical protein